MADRVVRVTHQSWGSRLGGSIKGIFVGVILAAVAVVVLFWNEGRAVKRARTLAEGSGSVVSVPAAAVDPGREGQLVHTTGEATTEELLTDPLFGVEATALALERQVEMYQWVQHEQSEERKKLGGGTETVTTYTYEREWQSSEVESSGFEEPSGHQNPPFPFSGETWRAADVRLGAYQLAPELAAQLDQGEELPFDETGLAAIDPSLREQVQLAAGGLYLGDDPGRPAVGDLRVRFEVVRPATVSVVAAQHGERLAPYRARAGGEIALVTYGSASADQMFAAAKAANTTLTWVLRLVGFVVLFVGIRSVLAPLQVLADVVPMIGRLVGGGVSAVSFAIAAPLALVTVAVGWLFYRPLLSVTLLALAAGIGFWLWRRSRKGRPALAPAMVPPPPPLPPAPVG